MKRLSDEIIHIFKVIYEDHAPGGWAIRGGRTPRNVRKFSRAWVLPCGDLNIMGDRGRIILCVNRSGGIGHLIRYWHHVLGRRGTRAVPEALFYVFLSPSRASSLHWRELWEFTLGRTKIEVGALLAATFAACVRVSLPDCPAGLPAPVIAHCRAQLEAQGILEQFRQLLAGYMPAIAEKGGP